MRAVAALSLAPLALAAAVPQDWSSWNTWPSNSNGSGRPATAYVLDDDPAGASIISFAIDAEGVIGNPIKTSTGGKGAYSVTSAGQPQVNDQLGTQGAVVVKGDHLFTVNAGSNTLAYFKIDPKDPQHPTLIDTIYTEGEFPVSVDYSHELKTACVLNGGKVGGVACFNVDPKSGLSSQGSLRAFPHSIYNETTPPLNPQGSASQVLFGPNSTAVWATIRGYPPQNAKQAPILGSIVAYPVSEGKISTDAVITQKDDLLLEFGFQFLRNGDLYLSDPSFGASLLTVNSDFSLTEKVHTVVPGEVAVCWTAAYYPLNTLYLLDAGSNYIFTLDATTGALTGNISTPLQGNSTNPNNSGVQDVGIHGGKLFGLASTDGIVVVDLHEKKQVQYFDISSVSPRLNLQGLAIFDAEA